MKRNSNMEKLTWSKPQYQISTWLRIWSSTKPALSSKISQSSSVAGSTSTEVAFATSVKALKYNVVPSWSPRHSASFVDTCKNRCLKSKIIYFVMSKQTHHHKIYILCLFPTIFMISNTIIWLQMMLYINKKGYHKKDNPYDCSLPYLWCVHQSQALYKS